MELSNYGRKSRILRQFTINQENAPSESYHVEVREYESHTASDELGDTIVNLLDTHHFNRAAVFIQKNEHEMVKARSISLAMYALAHADSFAPGVWASLKLKYLNLETAHLDMLVSSLTSPGYPVKTHSMTIDQLFTGRVAIQIIEGDASSATILINNLAPLSSLKVLTNLLKRMADCSFCRKCKSLPPPFIDSSAVFYCLFSEILKRDMSMLNASRCLYILKSIVDLEISSDLRQRLPLDALMAKLDEVMAVRLEKLEDFLEFSEMIFALDCQKPFKSIRKLKRFVTLNAFKISPEKTCLLAAAVGACNSVDAGFRNFLTTIVNAKTIRELSIPAVLHALRFLPKLARNEISNRDLTNIHDTETCAALILKFPEFSTNDMIKLILSSQLRPKIFFRVILSLSRVSNLNRFIFFIDANLETLNPSDACKIGCALARSFNGERMHASILRKIDEYISGHTVERDFRSALESEKLGYLIKPV